MPRSSSRLRDARKAAGLSQQALADRVGVAQQHIARWEGGAVEPKVRMAVRLSQALGTTVNALWQTDEPPSPFADATPAGRRHESERARRRREWNERQRLAETTPTGAS